MKTIDYREKIRDLDPASTLNEKNFETLLSKAELMELKANASLFKQGDVDKCHYFLLDGSIKIMSSLEDESTISSDSELANEVIAHNQPRKHTAVTKTPCILLKIESKTLDMILSWDHAAKYTVIELKPESRGNTEHWMESWLSNQIVQEVEPLNLQQFFTELEQQNLNTGDVVLRQNEPGDYFYILAAGSASITRTTKAHPDGLELAKIYAGDMFGEDALLAHRPRSATVTMTENGAVKRLPSERFIELLAKPLLEHVSYEASCDHDSLWLDVRLPAEHQRFSLPGSVNIPLIYLRIKDSHLSKDQRYVVYCDNGSRSAAAAFILKNAGFDVAVLQGGLQLAKNSLTAVSRTRVLELEAS